MRKYVIKDLERLSGIKSHTIRIWEQRYNLLTPERTDTNIRHYQDDDVRKLLNVSLLLDNGYKISKVSELTDADLYAEVERVLNASAQLTEQAETYIKGLIVAMVELDEERFNRVFSKAVQENGFQYTIINLIYPFLVRIGIMWGIEEINPAQEHFISCLIRQKIIATINDLPAATRSEKFVLYLHQGELHELGLLVAHYLLKSLGFQVIYLGQDVPFRDLEAVVHQAEPTHLLTIITTPTGKKELSHRIQQVNNSFPHIPVLYSGPKHMVEGIELPKNTQHLPNISSFVELLKKL